ncbi:GFA family protein [Yoonia sp. R2331]|uniref:GFA family protein n=1 Tax=Yoonia sp. R2331 TaxID=3237238 RepID=UPI0034E3FA8B
MTLTLAQAPRHRMFCHCGICQTVYRRAYSDFTISPWAHVSDANWDMIAFKRHKARFAVRRGTCKKCGDPVLAQLNYLPGINLALIPARVLDGVEDRLIPLQHVYYKSRVDDVADDLPKYEGALRSNIACLKPFFAAQMGR